MVENLTGPKEELDVKKGAQRCSLDNRTPVSPSRGIARGRNASCWRNPAVGDLDYAAVRLLRVRGYFSGVRQAPFLDKSRNRRALVDQHHIGVAHAHAGPDRHYLRVGITC
jgi:hypothetical protein